MQQLTTIWPRNPAEPETFATMGSDDLHLRRLADEWLVAVVDRDNTAKRLNAAVDAACREVAASGHAPWTVDAVLEPHAVPPTLAGQFGVRLVHFDQMKAIESKELAERWRIVALPGATTLDEASAAASKLGPRLYQEWVEASNAANRRHHVGSCEKALEVAERVVEHIEEQIVEAFPEGAFGVMVQLGVARYRLTEFGSEKPDPFTENPMRAAYESLVQLAGADIVARAPAPTFTG